MFNNNCILILTVLFVKKRSISTEHTFFSSRVKSRYYSGGSHPSEICFNPPVNNKLNSKVLKFILYKFYISQRLPKKKCLNSTLFSMVFKHFDFKEFYNDSTFMFFFLLIFVKHITHSLFLAF